MSRADGGSLQDASEDEGASRRSCPRSSREWHRRPRRGSRRPAARNRTERRLAGERERAGERDGPPPATGGRLAAVALLLFVCWSCGGPVPGPRPIELGKDTCAKCRHVITSLDAAAEVVHEDGTAAVYDDLGCLATDKAALQGGGQFYVQFAGGKGWMRVEDVHFASPKDRTSPQGYNYFAYTEDEARRIDPAGWARGWQDLVDELNRR